MPLLTATVRNVKDLMKLKLSNNWNSKNKTIVAEPDESKFFYIDDQ